MTAPREACALYHEINETIETLVSEDQECFPTNQYSVLINASSTDTSKSQIHWICQSALRTKGGESWSAIEAQYGSMSKNCSTNHEEDRPEWFSRMMLTSHGRIYGDAQLDNIARGLRIQVQFEDCCSNASGLASTLASTKSLRRLTLGPLACLGTQYRARDWSLTTKINAVNGPTIYGSVVRQVFGRWLLGGQLALNTHWEDESREEEPLALTDFNLLVGYHDPAFRFLFQTSKKMKIMKCSIFQSLDWNLTPPEPREPNNSIALGIEYTYNLKNDKKGLELGARFLPQDRTPENIMHGKINSHGIMSLSYTHRFQHMLKIIFCGQVDLKTFDSESHKFGLSFHLG